VAVAGAAGMAGMAAPAQAVPSHGRRPAGLTVRPEPAGSAW